MSYKIVRTFEHNKYKLLTVPSTWEEKNILKYPRKNINKYSKIGTSIPEPDWKKIKCDVKRRELPSYETAEYVLQEMLNHEDTEDDTTKTASCNQSKPQLNLNIIADEIVCPAKMTAVTESSEITTDTCTIPAAPPIGLDSDDIYQFHILSDNQNNIHQNQCCSANLEQSLAIQNVLLSNQTQILEQLNTITKVQNSIVQKVALFSVQLEDAVLQMNQTIDKDFHVAKLSEIRSTTSNTGFYVKPVDSIQKLNELEQQLSESSVRQQLKNTYSVICSGGKGIDCAYTLVDILFSRDLLCQCTWSGGSRKDDVKIAFKSYKNILSFFWGMIHSWDVTYTIKNNESFFKNILKNSKKRQMAKNQRASTSRKRAKLSKAQIANEEDNSDEDMSNDSEKIDAVNEENLITEESEEDQYIETEYEKNDDENKQNCSSKNKKLEEENEHIDEETKADPANYERSETKDETITEENKENIVELPKNTDESNEPSTSSNSNFKKDNSKPKTKIVKMLKKKREDKRLEQLKKIRRIHKNVSR